MVLPSLGHGQREQKQNLCWQAQQKKEGKKSEENQHRQGSQGKSLSRPLLLSQYDQRTRLGRGEAQGIVESMRAQNHQSYE